RREHWWRTQPGGTVRRCRRCSTEPRVDSADQLRISLGEVNVSDPAAAGEQIEGKLSWIEAGIARHVLEIARAFERRLLEALDDRLAFHLIVVEGGLEIVTPAQGIHQRDAVFHRQLRP